MNQQKELLRSLWVNLNSGQSVSRDSHVSCAIWSRSPENPTHINDLSMPMEAPYANPKPQPHWP